MTGVVSNELACRMCHESAFIASFPRWNTPMDDEEGEEAENRAMWGQGGDAGPAPAPSRKRPLEEPEEEEELDDDVKRRLAALRG